MRISGLRYDILEGIYLMDDNLDPFIVGISQLLCLFINIHNG